MKHSKTPREMPAPIAIIGMACIFPEAQDLASFWNNILNGVDAISEPVPDWGAERYLAAGRIRTQRGGFLRDLYRFDPREFGIMPNSVDGGETDQYLALRVARDALADAGYLRADANHHATGIVLGHSAYLHRGQVTVIQNNIVLDQTMDLLRVALPHAGDAALDEIRELLRKKLPPTTADNAPGLVPNMMTGRIANRLNLRGPNYVLDAACASSLLAVAAAADELRSGRSDMMLAGGVNATLPADVTTSFTQLGALSARGRVRPFEAGSDGTLLGEGLGVVVLKRLEDAIEDGDRVYAVLRGVGHSSDGKGAGLLAPSQDGETLAIRRAYELTGIDPATVGLVEAHGTGIPLGDQTEIDSLKSVFGERKTEIGIKALGSVKSMISHCIPGAGIAGLIKMALSLHHRVLPPTLCDEVNAKLGIDATPFYVNTRTAPWMARPGAVRRAAVNSFGFGGINAHAILEQAPTHARAPGRMTAWAVELCALSGDSAESLVQKLERLLDALAANPQWTLAEVAAALSRENHDGEHRVAMLARDVKELTANIASAIGTIREGKPTRKMSRARVIYSQHRTDAKIGFAFPGEGSQYQGMLADLALFPQVQHWLDFWHNLHDLPEGQTRTDIVFPTCEAKPERRVALDKRLHELDVGSEAAFIGGMAMFDLLDTLGVKPDVMVGHSSGESAALAASGANASSGVELADAIVRHCVAYEELLESDQIPTGALLTVGALPPEQIEAEITAQGNEVQVAMDNCSNQQVLYGSVEAIDRLEQRLTELGGICMRLPFDRGYHTPAFEAAARTYLDCYKHIKVGRPTVPLYSCATAARFPQAPEEVRELAASQWARKVRFRETVERMHDDGVRIFLEVGPSGNLVSFVNDILSGRDFLALPTNVRGRNGVEQLMFVLAWLYALGRWNTPERMHAEREIAAIDLDSRKPKQRPPLLDNTMPMLRLSPADRDRIGELVAAPQAGSYVAAADNPRAALGNFEDISANDVSDDGEPGWAEAAGLDAAGLDAGPRSTHANDSATPLLDSILEHDHEHVVATCRVIAGKRPLHPRPRALGPRLGGRSIAARARLRAVHGQHGTDGGSLCVAGRAHRYQRDRERARLRLDHARRRRAGNRSARRSARPRGESLPCVHAHAARRRGHRRIFILARFQAGAGGALARTARLEFRSAHIRAWSIRDVPWADVPEHAQYRRMGRHGSGYGDQRCRPGRLLRAWPYAKPDIEPGVAGCVEPGGAVLAAPVRGPRVPFLPVHDRAHRVVRTVPGRTWRHRDTRAPAAGRSRQRRHQRAAQLAIRLHRRRRPRADACPRDGQPVLPRSFGLSCAAHQSRPRHAGRAGRFPGGGCRLVGSAVARREVVPAVRRDLRAGTGACLARCGGARRVATAGTRRVAAAARMAYGPRGDQGSGAALGLREHRTIVVSRGY